MEKEVSDSIDSKNLLHINKLIVPQNWFAFIYLHLFTFNVEALLQK